MAPSSDLPALSQPGQSNAEATAFFLPCSTITRIGTDIAATLHERVSVIGLAVYRDRSILALRIPSPWGEPLALPVMVCLRRKSEDEPRLVKRAGIWGDDASEEA